jgi:hypothetical protein
VNPTTILTENKTEKQEGGGYSQEYSNGNTERRGRSSVRERQRERERRVTLSFGMTTKMVTRAGKARYF